MKRALMLFVLLVTGVAPVHAVPTTYEELLDEQETLAREFDQHAENALEKIADGDLAAAKAEAMLARQKLVDSDKLIADAKIGGVVPDLMPANLANTANTFIDSALGAWDLAIARLDDALRTKSQHATSLTGAAFRAARANSYVQRSNRSLNRMSLVATGPSLHLPGKKICWTLAGIPAADKGADVNACPYKATFVNPFGTSLGITPIQDNPFVAPYDNPCKGRVCFLMGRDLGGGRIEIQKKSDNSILARRLVFNYGSNTKSDGTPRTLISPNTMQPQALATLSGVSQYQGVYNGSFTGSCTYKVACFGDPVPPCPTPGGNFTSTISPTGKISVNVTGGGGGSGQMRPLGQYGTGGVTVPFAGGTVSAAFKGAILNNRFNDPTSAVASGTWSAANACGSGAGSWTATRN